MSDYNGVAFDLLPGSTGGSVVEFSPATREARVRFPASALFFLFLTLPKMAAPTVTAKDVRLRCRNGTFTGPTSGLADGYLQANLIMMPSQLADDFDQFCQVNYGPLPLLYKSEPGETAAPPLATDSDVRLVIWFWQCGGFQPLCSQVFIWARSVCISMLLPTGIPDSTK